MRILSPLICVILLNACGARTTIPSGMLRAPPPPSEAFVNQAAPPTPAPSVPVYPVEPAPPAVQAIAIKAASCEFPDVAAAVAAARPGDAVNIPAGNCNWGTAQLTVPAGISLQGAGRELTTIRRVGKVPNKTFLVAFDCANRNKVWFSGMTLTGNGSAAIEDNGLGLLNGCVDFRVSASRFRNFVFSGVYVGDAAGQRGVIFNNEFIDNFSPELMNLGYGVVVYGGGEWPDLELGSQNAVFVEDNYFSGNRHAIASNNGSAYVFRHNVVVGQSSTKDFAMTDVHGLSSSSVGSRSYEIYGNRYSTNFGKGLQRSAIGIRGGDGVIFDNTVSGKISRTVELIAEGFPCGSYPGPNQIRSLYLWNNSANPRNRYAANGVDNSCAVSIGLNRDYFLAPRPGYAPFAYPHPLRAAQ